MPNCRGPFGEEVAEVEMFQILFAKFSILALLLFPIMNLENFHFDLLEFI